MTDTLFSFLSALDNALWSYVGFPLLMTLGIYLSWKSRFLQIRAFPDVIRTFWFFLRQKSDEKTGVNPIRVFFACVGGCIGIGNVVAICTAVQFGGPGAVLWMWLAALVGMILKYAEIYLGVKYRVENPQGGYLGGPMYFLPKAFSFAGVASIVSVLLCIYGVEIYQFNIMTKSLSNSFDISPYYVAVPLLLLVLYAANGGVQRVGKISSTIIPVFIVLYLGMGSYVLFQNMEKIPAMFQQIYDSAFNGHAAIGGFLGGTFMMAASHGLRRASYSSDVGIGYASIIHSETSAERPEQQASFAIVEIFLDTFVICTMSVFLILLTDVWHEPIHESLLIQTALGQYFSYVNVFMPLFLSLLGYSTIIAYFCMGSKCAQYLSPRFGKSIYYVYAGVSLLLFVSVDTYQALIVMSIIQVLLLTINFAGIFRLRHEISYDLNPREEPAECSLG